MWGALYPGNGNFGSFGGNGSTGDPAANGAAIGSNTAFGNTAMGNILPMLMQSMFKSPSAQQPMSGPGATSMPTTASPGLLNMMFGRAPQNGLLSKLFPQQTQPSQPMNILPPIDQGGSDSNTSLEA